MEKHTGMGEENKPITSLHRHPDKGTIYAVGETMFFFFENTFSLLFPKAVICVPTFSNDSQVPQMDEISVCRTSLLLAADAAIECEFWSCGLFNETQRNWKGVQLFISPLSLWFSQSPI